MPLAPLLEILAMKKSAFGGCLRCGLSTFLQAGAQQY